MTAEQLEELADGETPELIGLESSEVIVSLARRVLAVEKLADVVDLYLGGASSNMQLQRALTTYREASK